MDGGSLFHFVQRVGRIPIAILKHITFQMTQGIHYLHSQFKIHRDIKPDNFLINHKGEVKVADFGLLKELKNSSTETFLGTMSYLSPERLGSLKYGFPSDIWSLGFTIMFCATGKNPFASYDMFELNETLTKPPPALDPAEFPEDLCDFVSKCLILNQYQRSTAENLLDHPFVRDRPDVRNHEVWQSPPDLEAVLEVVLVYERTPALLDRLSTTFELSPEEIQLAFERLERKDDHLSSAPSSPSDGERKCIDGLSPDQEDKETEV